MENGKTRSGIKKEHAQLIPFEMPQPYAALIDELALSKSGCYSRSVHTDRQ